MFEAPYCWTPAKGGTYTHFVDTQLSNTSMKHVWAPLFMKVQQYDTLNTAMCSKHAKEESFIFMWDRHR